MHLPHSWKSLQSEQDLERALIESADKPVVIFKHSTTCGISAHKFHDLVEDWNLSPDQVSFYYLDLLAYRPISNLVAEKLRVIHQSPQILIVRNGKAVANASHAYANLDFVKKHI